MATILERDENGALVLPARVLGHESAHARYVVEAQGETLLLRPEGKAAQPRAARARKKQTQEVWAKAWREFSAQVSKAWPEGGPSAVEVVSEMRNARGQGDVTNR